MQSEHGMQSEHETQREHETQYVRGMQSEHETQREHETQYVRGMQSEKHCGMQSVFACQQTAQESCFGPREHRVGVTIVPVRQLSR
jgi:hypothetical protein